MAVLPFWCYKDKSLLQIEFLYKSQFSQLTLESASDYITSVIFPSILLSFFSVVSLRCPPKYICKLRPIFGLILKFLWTLIVLLLTLFFRIDWPLLIMVQNPPGLPSLLACWLVVSSSSEISVHFHRTSWTCAKHHKK